LLRTGLLLQHLSQNFIYGFEDSPLQCHLKSRFCQAAIADPKRGPYFDILQTVFCRQSIFQWFNLIIYSLNTYRLIGYYDTMCSNWNRTKTWVSV